MDYDDNDFQNQNLHLAGEANSKFPPVLQPYALPKFDFDDTLNPHLRFDSLVGTEVFLGIEGNEDSNWIEDFSRGSSGIVFSSGANESCAISRHNNVWSEATSSESVEMLLNSVGQDEVIVRENTIKESDTADELGCTMEKMEPGQTFHEKSLSKEESENLQPNPSVDETPGEPSVLKADTAQESALVKDDSPTVAEEPSVEEQNDILASVEALDHDEIGTETTDRLLDQTDDKANEQTRMEVDCAADHDKIGSDTLLDQTENEANAQSRMEVDCSEGTVHTLVACTSELNNQKTLLPENDISDQIQSSSKRNLAIDAHSVLVEAHSDDSHIDEVEIAEAENENIGGTTKPEMKGIEPSDVTVLERGDQAFSTLEVGGQDVGASLELAGELTTLTSSVSTEQRESIGRQQLELIASEHESTFQTETHAQMHLVETSESVFISHADSMVESTIGGGVSKKSDNDEGSVHTSTNLMQSMEVTVNVYGRDPDTKSSQILSETVVSESAGHVSRGSASKLAESKPLSDNSPSDDSGTMVDGKESEPFPPNPEELRHLSQDGEPAVSLSSSIELDMPKTSSEANEQGTLSVSSGEPENDQTVPPVDASSSGCQMDQQATIHTEDSQQSTQLVDGCPASEGSKDVVDTDAEQVLPQQSEETISEENLVTEVGNAPEIQSVVKEDDVNEKPSTSSLANLESKSGKDGQEEDNTAASVGVLTAGTPVSHGKGDAGDSGASTCSEPSLKSHVTGTENAATNLGTPISVPTVKTSEPQLNKIETKNSVNKTEEQNRSSFVSPMLNRNEMFSSGMNLTDPRKAGDISKAVNFSDATLVSPIVVGSSSTCSLEKTPAKSSKTKSERKPRRTTKSAGKETCRKGSNVKGDTTAFQLQSGGRADAVSQSSATSIQITQSTEKQQTLQTPALKAFGTFATPTASLPDLNSSALSSILRRPFTDLQQVQLRAQIFVYGALIQGTAPDEAYMISAFGGPDGRKGGWEKAWRACVVRAQKLHLATPETPLQSHAGRIETPSASHTSSKENSATNPIIPLSSPLWSLSTSLDTLQSSQRGSAAAHQPLLSSSHAHQTPPVVGHNTPWISPLPYRNSWLASAQTSGFDVGSRFPVFPIAEPVKMTPMKESSLPPYSGGKHVQSGTPSNVFKGTPTVEPTSMVVAPAPQSTGTKSRKRKKTPVSSEPSPSILNSLKHTELAVSPLVSMSTSAPVTTTPVNLASNTGTLPNVVSTTASPMNLLSPYSGKKIKPSFPSPIFGGNLLPGNLEVKQRYVLSEDSIDKLKEAKMHAEDASALAAAAVGHSEYVWKQIDQQRNFGLEAETQSRLAAAAVAIAAAAAVAKAAAAAANVAANAALQAKLMAEEASLPSASVLGSILKGEGSAVSSIVAVREAAKKRVEAATAATKRAENMDSIVKAAELASEAVSQAGILVSMGHPPSLNELMEAGPSNYWRNAQESQPSKKETVATPPPTTSDGTSGSLRAVQTELVDGSVRRPDGLSGSVSATEKKTKGQNSHKGADLAKNNAVVFEPEVGSKSSADTQTEREQITRTTSHGDIKEGSNVEVFKEGPGIRTAWYSANVLSLEDDKAYVLFNDLSVEEGTDKLKEWIALKGEGEEAPKIRSARSVTALPYEGTRKRRRAAIGDPVWKIGDKVDSWVQDSWLEGVITEKNKKDENTVTVHFPAQGDNLTIKAWNLRPSLEWKDGKWIECTSSSSGGNITSSSMHEGDTPKEKRPKLAPPAPLVVERKETSTRKIVDNPELAKARGLLDLGVTENTFNIGTTSTKDENKPDPLRTKRTGLQKQGSKVFGVPKPGKKRKFMDVSKHYDSEASNKAARGEQRKEPANSNKPLKPQPGGWRLPCKTVSREKQTTTATISKPKTFKPTKEKPGGAASRVIPRKDSDMESDALDQTAESKGETPVNVPSSQDPSSKKSSSSTTNKGKVGPTGRLAKIEEDKALAESSSSKPTTDGTEPRRSNRRIQPTSRLLEGLQTSMMTSKIPSVSHSKSHQSQSKK